MADKEIKTAEIVTLPGTVIEEYDPEKGKLTLENPENDWSHKMTNGIDGEDGDDE